MNNGNTSEFTIRELADKAIALTGQSQRLLKPLPGHDLVERQPDISRTRLVRDQGPEAAPLDETCCSAVLAPLPCRP